MTEGKTGVRLRVLAALCAFMFAALGTRLWFVQVLASEQYKKIGQRNAARVVDLAAPRGRILDRDGEVLVQNRPSLVVTVNRQEMGDNEDELLFRLAKLLDMPVSDLLAQLNTKRYYAYTPVPVAFDVPRRVALYIGEHQWQFPGVAAQELAVRVYPFGDLAAHVLGYTNQVSPQQLDRPQFAGYDPNDTVGKEGVEATYEKYLRGTKGAVKLRVDSSGRNLGPIGRKAPVPGDDVVLAISQRVQRLSERSLALGMQAARAAGLEHARAGAVVVMNPTNGQIVALASAPGYDPSVFESGKPKELARLLQNNTTFPLFDRATQAAYPPGSTFKPFVALSALREGFATLTKYYNCPATWTVPGTENSEAGPDIKNNWSSYDQGFMHLDRALVVSCDTVFYPFGWEFWRDYFHNRRELLQRDLTSFGFGRPSFSDLPGEKPGLIPTAKWKAEHYRDAAKIDQFADEWLPGDDINMSIGQGDVQVTPLQLAVAYSAIANGGTVWEPHVGLRIQDPGGETVRRIDPPPIGKLPFTPKQLDYVRNGLRGVVSDPAGTAFSAFRGFPFARVSVAGKTGTAQVPTKEDYSWFAAMAPVEHPRFVVVALVEQGGHGSQTAAPVVRRILDGLFGLQLHDPLTGQAVD